MFHSYTILTLFIVCEARQKVREGEAEREREREEGENEAKNKEDARAYSIINCSIIKCNLGNTLCGACV